GRKAKDIKDCKDCKDDKDKEKPEKGPKDDACLPSRMSLQSLQSFGSLIPTARYRIPPMTPVNVFELEAIARERLSPEAWDYYAGGAHDEVTLRGNRGAYDRLSLAYRVLVDVSRRELAT